MQSLPSYAITTNSPTSELVLHELTVFYENSLDYLAKDFCKKSKIFSLKLLNDEVINKSTTALMQEFKSNLSDYLNNYSHYERYGQYEFLLKYFVDTTFGYYDQETSDDLDVQYILHYLHADYDLICDEYEIKFKKFITQNFLPLIELKRPVISKQKIKPIMHYVGILKNCLNYECFYNNAKSLINIIKSPEDEQAKFYKRFNILIAIITDNVFKSVLKDENLTQLSNESLDIIVPYLKNFIYKFKQDNHIEQLIKLNEKYMLHVPNITTKDEKLLQKILDKYTEREIDAKEKQIMQLLDMFMQLYFNCYIFDEILVVKIVELN